MTVTRSLIWAAGLLLLSSTSHAQDDDYMLNLESAMDEVTSGDIRANELPVPPAVNNASPQQESFLDEIGVEMEGMDGPGGQQVPENAHDQFDSDLRDRMPGTFVLYKRLSNEKKDVVFEEYQVSGDYLRVRRKIIELRRAR